MPFQLEHLKQICDLACTAEEIMNGTKKCPTYKKNMPPPSPPPILTVSEADAELDSKGISSILATKYNIDVLTTLYSHSTAASLYIYRR